MGSETDKPGRFDQRREVRREAEKMSPPAKADFTDTASHASAAVDDTSIYKIAAGDDLQSVAKRCYGNADDWQRILDANRDLIGDPHHLTPGLILKIPARR